MAKCRERTGTEGASRGSSAKAHRSRARATRLFAVPPRFQLLLCCTTVARALGSIAAVREIDILDGLTLFGIV